MIRWDLTEVRWNLTEVYLQCLWSGKIILRFISSACDQVRPYWGLSPVSVIRWDHITVFLSSPVPVIRWDHTEVSLSSPVPILGWNLTEVSLSSPVSVISEMLLRFLCHLQFLSSSETLLRFISSVCDHASIYLCCFTWVQVWNWNWLFYVLLHFCIDMLQRKGGKRMLISLAGKAHMPFCRWTPQHCLWHCSGVSLVSDSPLCLRRKPSYHSVGGLPSVASDAVMLACTMTAHFRPFKEDFWALPFLCCSPCWLLLFIKYIVMLLFRGKVSKQRPDHGPSTPCNDSGLGTVSACCAAYISVVFVSLWTRDDFDHSALYISVVFVSLWTRDDFDHSALYISVVFVSLWTRDDFDHSALYISVVFVSLWTRDDFDHSALYISVVFVSLWTRGDFDCCIVYLICQWCVCFPVHQIWFWLLYLIHQCCVCFPVHQIWFWPQCLIHQCCVCFPVHQRWFWPQCLIHQCCVCFPVHQRWFWPWHWVSAAGYEIQWSSRQNSGWQLWPLEGINLVVVICHYVDISVIRFINRYIPRWTIC